MQENSPCGSSRSSLLSVCMRRKVPSDENLHEVAPLPRWSRYASAAARDDQMLAGVPAGPSTLRRRPRSVCTVGPPDPKRYTWAAEDEEATPRMVSPLSASLQCDGVQSVSDGVTQESPSDSDCWPYTTSSGVPPWPTPARRAEEDKPHYHSDKEKKRGKGGENRTALLFTLAHSAPRRRRERTRRERAGGDGGEGGAAHRGGEPCAAGLRALGGVRGAEEAVAVAFGQAAALGRLVVEAMDSRSLGCVSDERGWAQMGRSLSVAVVQCSAVFDDDAVLLVRLPLRARARLLIFLFLPCGAAARHPFLLSLPPSALGSASLSDPTLSPRARGRAWRRPVGARGCILLRCWIILFSGARCSALSLVTAWPGQEDTQKQMSGRRAKNGRNRCRHRGDHTRSQAVLSTAGE